ncbi:hypothetical protein OG894_42075 (plasmid) [Streptomyces sp. NBC_01724]|uniref:hypothetical protein n=1 Tax=Streptomyces sp. NBC_01724 TaxID=2975922 RepID=UPI002E36BA18|nr:hypothetical protein [Streptomyces sp. NBC_01724]
MSVPTLEPAARMRRSRTRTRKVSARPALVLSSLKPHQYDLRPTCTSLICPDCKTWCPITGIQAKVQKLVPHHAGTAHEDKAIRCSGSHRRVTVDVTYEAWLRRLETGFAETDGRRSARQHYKPLPAPAKPVAKMTPVPLNAADALTAYGEHLKNCRMAARCDGTRRCADGVQLAALYEQLQRTQPRRDREHQEEARVDALLTRYRVATAGRRTAAEWAKQDEDTVDATKATAKRSGTTVEEANNACRIHPADTVSEFRGPEVPLEPMQISA